MAKAVFYHRPDSIYDDRLEEFYHFPGQYLSRVTQTIGDHIIYYGPSGSEGRYYVATAKVTGIRPDKKRSNHYYADVTQYLDFDRQVPYTEHGGYEKQLVLPDGRISGGRAVQAVRIIDPPEFAAIINAGLSTPYPWPDRYDTEEGDSSILGFGEEPQAEYERPVVLQLLNRKFRDAKFRQHVKLVYDRTCAFTGLRLINGKGRPEVEAAHIQPVEANGPDSIRNGIALSGTVHWMFDRGLLSLADDFTILKSRHLNHDVSNLLRSDMKALVPEDRRLQPHPHFLNWHRANCFKC